MVIKTSSTNVLLMVSIVWLVWLLGTPKLLHIPMPISILLLLL